MVFIVAYCVLACRYYSFYQLKQKVFSPVSLSISIDPLSAPYVQCPRKDNFIGSVFLEIVTLLNSQILHVSNPFVFRTSVSKVHFVFPFSTNVKSGERVSLRLVKIKCPSLARSNVCTESETGK